MLCGSLCHRACRRTQAQAWTLRPRTSRSRARATRPGARCGILAAPRAAIPRRCRLWPPGRRPRRQSRRRLRRVRQRGTVSGPGSGTRHLRSLCRTSANLPCLRTTGRDRAWIWGLRTLLPHRNGGGRCPCSNHPASRGAFHQPRSSGSRCGRVPRFHHHRFRSERCSEHCSEHSIGSIHGSGPKWSGFAGSHREGITCFRLLRPWK